MHCPRLAWCQTYKLGSPAQSLPALLCLLLLLLASWDAVSRWCCSSVQLMSVRVSWKKECWAGNRSQIVLHQDRQTDCVSVRTVPTPDPIQILLHYFRVSRILSVSLNASFGSRMPSHPGCFIGNPPRSCTLHNGGKKHVAVKTLWEPPVPLDFPPPVANSFDLSGSEGSLSAALGSVLVTPSTSVMFSRAIGSWCWCCPLDLSSAHILCGFFCSTSNLYATRVIGTRQWNYAECNFDFKRTSVSSIDLLRQSNSASEPRSDIRGHPHTHHRTSPHPLLHVFRPIRLSAEVAPCGLMEGAAWLDGALLERRLQGSGAVLSLTTRSALHVPDRCTCPRTVQCVFCCQFNACLLFFL